MLSQESSAGTAPKAAGAGRCPTKDSEKRKGGSHGGHGTQSSQEGHQRECQQHSSSAAVVHGMGEACCRCTKSREQLPCSPVVLTEAVASSVLSMHHGSWVQPAGWRDARGRRMLSLPRPWLSGNSDQSSQQ